MWNLEIFSILSVQIIMCLMMAFFSATFYDTRQCRRYSLFIQSLCIRVYVHMQMTYKILRQWTYEYNAIKSIKKVYMLICLFFFRVCYFQRDELRSFFNGFYSSIYFTFVMCFVHSFVLPIFIPFDAIIHATYLPQSYHIFIYNKFVCLLNIKKIKWKEQRQSLKYYIGSSSFNNHIKKSILLEIHIWLERVNFNSA